MALLPPRFADLKQQIAAFYGPSFQENITRAWSEICDELNTVTEVIGAQQADYIPQVSFSDLAKLDDKTVAEIRRKGTVIVRDIVDDTQASKWKEICREYVTTNPGVEGTPAEDKQFFQLYWTQSQVEARSHPNLLATTTWLNQLYHLSDSSTPQITEGVDLSVPLTYADRFRIRKPGGDWNFHPPHIDGGTIERWEDPAFRQCFADIFEGNWRKHDPFDLSNRLRARSSLYGRPNQSSIFRSFQGWVAMSETAPTQGTLRVFPDVLLSNAYIILRPFFTPTVPEDSEEIFNPKNWEFDLSKPCFHGVYPRDGGYAGPNPNPQLHPHLRLGKTMISIPKVYPGDAVFWHCDVVHSVEREHTGTNDSAVMYIPAVPLTPGNWEYVQRQKTCFLQGDRPPDFPKGPSEGSNVGVATVESIKSPEGLRAMGFEVTVR